LLNVNMARILFAIPSLKYGGAASVVLTLAEHFSLRTKHRISILTLYPESIYQIDDSLSIVSVFKLFNNVNSYYLKFIRRLLYWPLLTASLLNEKPSLVITSQRGFNWQIILVSKIFKIPCIAIEHTNHTFEVGIGSFVERFFGYRLASHLVVLSQFDCNYYTSFLKRVSVIDNPLRFMPSSDYAYKENIIMAAGDFSRWYVKGFDVLLKAFSSFASDYPDWRLVIVSPISCGSNILENFAHGFGLSKEQFSFVIDSDTYLNYLRRSSIFCLPSRHEGFSMALLEAMSQSCYCVAADCITGPRYLLQDGICGRLIDVGSDTSLSAALLEAINLGKMRSRVATKAYLRSYSFTPRKIYRSWENIMKPLLHHA